MIRYRRRHFDDYPEGVTDEQWLQTWLATTDENRLDENLVDNLVGTYESFL